LGGSAGIVGREALLDSAAATGWLDPGVRGFLKDWNHQDGSAVAGTFGGFVGLSAPDKWWDVQAWDGFNPAQAWVDNPGGAAGTTAFNIGTLVVPGVEGVGALGDGVKFAGATEHGVQAADLAADAGHGAAGAVGLKAVDGVAGADRLAASAHGLTPSEAAAVSPHVGVPSVDAGLSGLKDGVKVPEPVGLPETSIAVGQEAVVPPVRVPEHVPEAALPALPEHVPAGLHAPVQPVHEPALVGADAPHPADGSHAGGAADVSHPGDVGPAGAGDAGHSGQLDLDSGAAGVHPELHTVEVSSGTPGGWEHALYHKNLLPQTQYVVDGGKWMFQTDHLSRVVYAEGHLDGINDLVDRVRHSGQQVHAGGVDRLPGDHGGHIFATLFGGPGEGVNLTAQFGKLNLGAYKALENDWAKAITDGHTVDVRVTIDHPEGSVRPSQYVVGYRVDDGRWLRKVFANGPG
jgi:hypothetical protein